MSQRKAVTSKKALAYRGASRREKSRILDELVDLTGWHRDWARAALREALVLRPVASRKPRPPVYGPELMPALIRCWAVLRAPAGKLLAPMMPTLVPLLRRDAEIDVTDEQAALLTRMSAATIDRKLAPERAKMTLRGRSHTKPGSLLKSQIPIRTWAEWDDAVPGFVEIDLVGHEGGNPSGEFCFTLTVTDIATGWTVNRSEFINEHLFRYCEQHHITFTRSRPGNKNDGAHVEQKNWARVRELVGDLRYDTAGELELLNQIWELDRVFMNHLLPQQKLLSRQRIGARVIKKHEAPATPHQRSTRHPAMRKRPIITMNAALKRIKPAALSREILALTGHLETIAQAKKPAPEHASINQAFVR